MPESKMTDEAVHLMLDANSLMHFQRPDQIDWLTLLKCRSVTLIVTPILLRELEEQKVTNRSRKLRDRARSIVTWIASFIDEEGPLEIKKGVLLALVRHSPQIDFGEHRLSRFVADDELIATALEYQTVNNCRVSIFTNDTGLRLKLPPHQIRVIVPPEELGLPNEPDELEKENSNLKAQLSRHQNRLPLLRFSLVDGSNCYRLPCLQAAVKALRPAAPEPFGMGVGDYGEYRKEFAAWKNNALLATGFRIRLFNGGSAVATNIRIHIQFPAFIMAVPLGKPPVAPRLSSFTFSRDFDLPSETAPEYSDDCDGVTFNLTNLVHNRTFDSDEIFLRFRSKGVVQNFSCEYFITCVENIEPIRDRLHFTVEDWRATELHITSSKSNEP
jgi:rRNA-processing protein FCF1